MGQRWRGLLAPFFGAAAPFAVRRSRWSLDYGQLPTFHFQLFWRFIFGKKRLASVFPNLSSPGVEQEKTSVLNGQFWAALKSEFF